MTATVTGLKAIDRRFERLTGSQQRKYIRQGAAAAASVQIKAAKRLVPDRKTRDTKGKLTGLKRAFMKVPSSKWKNSSELRRQGIIGSRVGFRRSKGAHAHLVEFGHKIVAKGGRDTGKRVRPYPFMRPAMDASKGKFRRAFQQKIIAGIRANTR
jgi:HK97 gp10 family phage protein